MSTDEAGPRERFLRADALPPGSERTAALDEARRAAEADGGLRTEIHLAQLADASRSGASARLFAPLARLLRVLDERPGDLGPDRQRALHRAFPGAVDAMVAQPHVPLDAIEEWLGEAYERTGRAGYSLRGIHRAEAAFALHLGDAGRAERAVDAWRRAPRDGAAECRGCELLFEGRLLAGADDARALRAWQPLLTPRDGLPGGPEQREAGCAVCRASALAASVLPLVRVGRTALARGHHLRGYRLARTVPGALGDVAAHLEFCARTGNERRGFEILAEQYLAGEPGSGEPAARLEWLVAVSLVLRRSCELGGGEERLHTPDGGRPTTASHLRATLDEALDLAARFDRRNGTSAAGDRSKVRLAAAPLLDALTVHGGSTEPLPHGGPEQLLAHARQSSADGRPEAQAAWSAVDAASDHGALLPGAARAELRDHRAMDLARSRPGAAVTEFLGAAAEFDACGLPGSALACRARAVLATAFAGDPAAALAEADELCGVAHRLLGSGDADLRQATAVLLTRARIESALLPDAPRPDAAAAQLDARLAELVALAQPYAAEPAVRARIAEATESRGRLAERCADDPRAREYLGAAVACYRAAGRPWSAAGAQLALARVLLEAEDLEEAVRVLTAALDDADRGDVPASADHVRLRLLYAEAVEAAGGWREAAAAWREAALAAEEEGDGEGAGALARMRLGGALLTLGLHRAAVRTLRRALPLLDEAHPPSRRARAHFWLASAYGALAAHRSAAEEYAAAADLTDREDDPYGGAHLRHLAADSYAEAGYDDEAARAYALADAAWRSLGEPAPLARVLRTRARLVLRAARQAPAPALSEAAGEGVALLADAVRGLRHHMPSAPAGELRTELALELGHTHLLIAELLDHRIPPEPRRAADEWDAAATAYAEAAEAGGELGAEAREAYGEVRRRAAGCGGRGLVR